MKTNRKTIITDQLLSLLREEGVEAKDLQDSNRLADLGLDSLGFAILIARLETSLGFDPFTEALISEYPETLGDFIEIYESF